MTNFKHYLQNSGVLYGEGEENPFASPPRRKKVSRITYATEAKEQMIFVNWLQSKNILHYHCPNGGLRNKREAYMLKLLGVVAGVPDLCITIARGGFHGLYIEMKRKSGGVLSDAQKYWISKLREQGYRVEVCKGADEAIQTTTEYLNNE